MAHGIKEEDFWGMTPAELERAMEAKAKEREHRMKERAMMDYALAGLFTRGMRIALDSGQLPDIEDAYPWLFNDEETKERKANQEAEAWAAKFRAFADAHNMRMEKEVRENEERTA